MAPPAVITTLSSSNSQSQSGFNMNYPPQSSSQHPHMMQQHMMQQQQQQLGGMHLPPGTGGPGATTLVPVTPSASSSPQEDAVVHGQWQHMTRTLYHYDRLEQIGEGTYGQVYRAVCKDTGRQVALKKMRLHHGGYWGMPLQLVREIKILKRLRHPNLLQMLEVVTSKGVEYLDQDDEHSQDAAANNKDGSSNKQDRVSDAREAYKGNLFLVLEYISHDLTGLIDVGHVFDDRAIKTIMQQLFRAIAYLHENKYVHRDIKSSNILIDSFHRLKLADFGLARCLEPPILDQMVDRASSLELTNKVITLWYRPPEILLGSTNYTTLVDVWSAGCILAELCLNRPIFSGKTEIDQLSLIAEVLGTPGDDTVAHLTTLKRVRSGEMHFPAPRKSKLDKYSSKMKPEVTALLQKTLEWDPRKRVTAANALSQRYFRTQPLAAEDPATLPPIEGPHFHEFQTKKKRKEAKAVAEKAKDDLLAVGVSEEEARGEFDKVYRSLMKKVALEGLGASVKGNGNGKGPADASHPPVFPPKIGPPLSAGETLAFATHQPPPLQKDLPFAASQYATVGASSDADASVVLLSSSRPSRRGDEGLDHDRRKRRDDWSMSPRSGDEAGDRHRRRKHERHRGGDRDAPPNDGGGGDSKRRSSSKRSDRDEDHHRRHRSSPASERDSHHRQRRSSREKERDRGDTDDADRHHRKSKRRDRDHDRERDRGDRRRSSKKNRRDRDDEVPKSPIDEEERELDRRSESRSRGRDEPVEPMASPQRPDDLPRDGQLNDPQESGPADASKEYRTEDLLRLDDKQKDNAPELRRVEERPRAAAPEPRRVDERPRDAPPEPRRVEERPKDAGPKPLRVDERPRDAAPEIRRGNDRPRDGAPRGASLQRRDDDRSWNRSQGGTLEWHPPTVPRGDYPPGDRSRPAGAGARGPAPSRGDRVDDRGRSGRGGDGWDRPRPRSPPSHRAAPDYEDRGGRGAYGGGGGGGGYEGRGGRGAAGEGLRRDDRAWDRDRDRRRDDRRPLSVPPLDHRDRPPTMDRDLPPNSQGRFAPPPPPPAGPSDSGRDYGSSRDGPYARGGAGPPIRGGDDPSYGPPRPRHPGDGGDRRGWQPPRDHRDGRR